MAKVSKYSFSRRNRSSLLNIARIHLRQLRQQHPEWGIENVVRELDLPNSLMFQELLRRSGFADLDRPSEEETKTILRMQRSGVWSDEIIASETGIPLQKVSKVIRHDQPGFGTTPFGVMPYGRHRALSNGNSFVQRRVTTSGQLSYKGKLYTLGAEYRGRIAMIRQEGHRLIAVFGDKPTLDL